MKRYPAEWEEQRTIWLSWPFHQKHWGERLESIRQFYVELISICTRYQKVSLIVDPSLNAADVFAQMEASKGAYPLEIYTLPHNDVWVRDYGPFFIYDFNDGVSHKEILDFSFNAWGQKFPPWNLDNAIPTRLAEQLKLPIRSIDYVLEGGAVEFNGHDLLLTSEQCLLNKNRNPHFTQAQTEELLRSSFGVQHVLWLNKGLEGDHTDGHIDDFARFVSADTILLAMPGNDDPINYSYMQDNEERLKQFQKKIPELKYQTLPLPPLMEYGEERLPCSYANFIYLNNAIVVPIFDCPQDAQALHIFKNLFPSRDIIPLNCRLLIQEGGGLHCISKQEPL
jgi:agmatine deiminase